MEAKTDLPNAKFCLEETVQETKQRTAFYCRTNPPEKHSKWSRSHISTTGRPHSLRPPVCRAKLARHQPNTCLQNHWVWYRTKKYRPRHGDWVLLKVQTVANKIKIKLSIEAGYMCVTAFWLYIILCADEMKQVKMVSKSSDDISMMNYFDELNLLGDTSLYFRVI